MEFEEFLSYIIENQFNGSRKEFSIATGIPLTTVSEYIRGKKKDPPLSLLRKVENVNTSWSLSDGKFVFEGDLSAKEHKEPYNKTDIIDLLISAIEEVDGSKRVGMLQKAIKLYGRVLEENGLLRAEVNQLQKDMLAIARRA